MNRLPGNNTKEAIESRRKRILEILSKDKNISNKALAERVGCGLALVREVRGKK